MLHAHSFSNATRMHDGITRHLAFARAPKLDFWSSVDVHLCNMMLFSESFEWEFDLKDLWLTGSRWSTLVRQYIDIRELDDWLALIEDRMRFKGKKSRGMALMRTKKVQARTHGNKTSRRWGSCMLAVSFRRVPAPQITLYSRTSYMGYLAPLDITVAHTCAQLVSEITDIPVEEMSFVWMMEDAQYSFKSLAYLFNNPDYYDRLESVDLSTMGSQAPGLYLSAKWFDVFRKEDEEGKLYGDMTWGACRRIRRRWHTEVYGYDYGEQFVGGSRPSQGNRYKPLPSVPSHTLSFAPLRKTVNDVASVQFRDLIF